jgi:hypothetical protein
MLILATYFIQDHVFSSHRIRRIRVPCIYTRNGYICERSDHLACRNLSKERRVFNTNTNNTQRVFVATSDSSLSFGNAGEATRTTASRGTPSDRKMSYTYRNIKNELRHVKPDGPCDNLLQPASPVCSLSKNKDQQPIAIQQG